MPPRRDSLSSIRSHRSGTAPVASARPWRFRLAPLLTALLVGGAVWAGAAAPAQAVEGAGPELDATISVTQYPRSIVASADGSLMYVAVDNAFAVMVVDTATNARIRQISLGSMRPGLMIGSPDRSRLFTLGGSKVAIIEPATDDVNLVDLPADGESMQVSPDGSRLYVTTSNASPTIVTIDAATGVVEDTTALSGVGRALAVSPDGQTLYYAQNDGLYALITTTFQQLSFSNPANVYQAALSPDGTRLYVVDGMNTTSIVDASTGAVLDTIPSAVQAVAIALSPDGTELYRINTQTSFEMGMPTQTSSLSIIDTGTGDVTGTAPLPWSSWRIFVDTEDGMVWVTGAQGVAVVDPDTTTTESVDLVFAIVALAFVPDTQRAYAISDGGGAAFALSLAPPSAPALAPTTRTVTATFGEPLMPTAGWSATDFGGTVTYAVSPTIPAGLNFDTVTGSVSGTPTGPVQSATDYTVTGTGSSSGVATATLTIGIEATAPGAPLSAAAVPGALQAFVSWTAPVSDGGGGALTYTVTAASGGATCTTTTTSCIVTGLTADTTYTFDITASTGVGTSLATSTSAVLVPASVAPATPPVPSLGTTVRLETPGGTVVTSIHAGRQYFAEVGGFAPDSFVEAVLYSVPVVVGSGVTDASGAARFAITIPADLAAGSHTLVIAGFGAGGSTAFAAVGVTAPAASAAVAAARLADSGGGEPDRTAASAGLMLLIFGAAVLAVTRRPRSGASLR